MRPRAARSRVSSKVKRIILVVGCEGGEGADPALRPLIGEVAHYKVRKRARARQRRPAACGLRLHAQQERRAGDRRRREPHEHAFSFVCVRGRGATQPTMPCCARRCAVAMQSDTMGTCMRCSRVSAACTRLPVRIRPPACRTEPLVVQAAVALAGARGRGGWRGAQADIVILTNDNPREEAPDEIIADIVAGFPEYVLKHNAIQPFAPGFLQDPGRVEYTDLEFLWDAANECAPASGPRVINPNPILSATLLLFPRLLARA
jgi:hypothetical protein